MEPHNNDRTGGSDDGRQNVHRHCSSSFTNDPKKQIEYRWKLMDHTKKEEGKKERGPPPSSSDVEPCDFFIQALHRGSASSALAPPSYPFMKWCSLFFPASTCIGVFCFFGFLLLFFLMLKNPSLGGVVGRNTCSLSVFDVDYRQESKKQKCGYARSFALLALVELETVDLFDFLISFRRSSSCFC